MEIVGYAASILIGVSLGLIGGGGSILTIPVLVYLLRVAPVTASAYSLFIVGTTSLVGVWPKYRQQMVHFKTALIFGAPSIIAVYLTREFIVPAIPEQIGHIAGFEISKALLMMLLFAVLMMGASVSMIRNGSQKTKEEVDDPATVNYIRVFIQAAFVGLITGLVGAGGGFLIIPALMMLGKLPIKTAIGTSLLIIAANSLIGFSGDMWSSFIAIDWKLLLNVTSLAVLGIFIGNALSKKIEGAKLKKGFGWFVLAMAVYIIGKELLK